MQSPLLHANLMQLDRAWVDRPAVAAASGILTYGQLRERAVKLAQWLRENGCRGPSDRIAVCLPKSLESVQAILGVLASGAAYVPLDVAAPPARLQAIIASARPQRLLTTAEIADKLRVGPAGDDSPPITIVRELGKGRGLDPIISNAPDGAPPCTAKPDDLAALLFTSGSTGRPKGVMLTHRNISSFVQWAVEKFGLSAEDRLTSHAPFHFDLSTFDLFGAFRVGACVYLLSETEVKFPAEVSRILQRERISVWYSVPTALRMLVDHGGLNRRDLSALRLVHFAGEAFPVPSLRRLMAALPHAEFVNLYGPTETNVCTYYRLPAPLGEGERAIPIGVPCEHLEVTIRGASGEPVGAGETGEICVAGPAVMAGYWQDPAQTQEAQLRGRVDSYRTGDFGSWNADGTIHFAGRRDAQVKIRGHRIELGEIESVLLSHPGIEEAAVFAVEGAGPDKELVAFVAPGAKETVSESGVRRHCARFLPSYSRPDRIVLKDAFPRLSTGKTDRRTLEKSIGGAKGATNT